MFCGDLKRLRKSNKRGTIIKWSRRYAGIEQTKHSIENRIIHPLIDPSEGKASKKPPNIISIKANKNVIRERSLYDLTIIHDKNPAIIHTIINGSDIVKRNSKFTPVL